MWKQRKWFWGFCFLFGLLASMTFGAWWGYHQVTTASKVGMSFTKKYPKLAKAMSLIADSYVEKVSPERLTDGAIKGMMESLGDPYSVYMDKQAASQFEESLDSSFEGIGAEISDIDGKLVIVAPFHGSPAEKAGVLANDQIVSVDGKGVAGLSVSEVVTQIRGPKGTVVSLALHRTGLKEPLVLKIRRDEIPVETVTAERKVVSGRQVGYMRISQFGEHTAEDFARLLAGLEEKPLDGLVLDVRGNPGGLLSSVEDVLGHFVTKERPLVQIQDRAGRVDTYYSKLRRKKEYPIVVLVDKGSASAAEILAAAMSEAGGYPLIGEKSFGKGTVQQAVPLGDGSEIKMTLYRWLTPDGQWIHKKGIAPTVPVSQPAYFRLAPLSGDEILKRNQTGDAVKLLQETLAAEGFVPGREDGYFDEKTEAAVKAFQIAEGLKPSGQVDEKTVTILQEKLAKMKKNETNDLQLQTALRLLVE